MWTIIIIIVLAVLFIFIYYFNKLTVLENRIKNSLGQINVQLKRRADLIPNLIETVKGYAKHERKIIKEVTEARKALVQAKTIDKKIQANQQLESALKSIFALAEGYPDLKANQNFLELQRELTTTEDKIAYARQYYNDSILNYNNLCLTFPGKIFAVIIGKKPMKYVDIAPSEKEIPKVSFE